MCCGDKSVQKRETGQCTGKEAQSSGPLQHKAQYREVAEWLGMTRGTAYLAEEARDREGNRPQTGRR